MATTDGTDSATIFHVHWIPIVQSSRFSNSPNPSCIESTSQPAAKITATHIANHRRPTRGDRVGSADNRATVTPEAAITPMLAIFHQNEGTYIA
jgi:hypothetical protein